MIDDYLWSMLYAQREAELRARAHRRGGEPASSAPRRPGALRRLRLRLRRGPVPATAQAMTAATATTGLIFPTPGAGTAARAATPPAPLSEEKAA